METSSSDFEERASLCALNRIFGFEPRFGAALVDAFGSAASVFRQPQEEIKDILSTYARDRFAPQITESAFDAAAMELEELESQGCRFIGINESAYPLLLKECEDPPLGLYFKGASPPEKVFGGIPAIAIIGTRDLTSYGKEWCERLVEAMSKASIKPLIVSGLAIGVDITAHKTALECGLPTVAVMATGIDSLYPCCNRHVGKEIADTEGCALVTDFPPGTDPIKFYFLRRNRIIAGMSRATVLVESKVKGGGMMTAHLASSYGRDVYALPGRIDDPVSQGCNLIIRENIAEPISSLEDFIARVGLGSADIALKDNYRKEVESWYAGRPDSDCILKAAMEIKKHRGISLEEISAKLGLSYSEASQIATELECDGFIVMDILQHCSAARRRM